MAGFIKSLDCSNLTTFSKDEGGKIKIDNSNIETKVNIEQAKKIIDENKELIIFDMRTKEEYNSGHIKNAILIPYDKINENINFIKQYKDRAVLVYCRSGMRSTIGVKSLMDNGFSKIYHMYQGILMWRYDLFK
ncbi:rhodanese-like domain-containing protein [Clostridium lundense]|uniref:rhodanese-like domain-containing protein n=1 Tax=Clostridium lundense TaxID=319475 RepID=UPI000A69B641|nr:rhodanese-like domain-containing protein [Clostridium lundense]